MKTFENPSNGYRESVPSAAALWALLFGLFYFMVRGAWAHAVIYLILCLVAVATGPLAVLLIPVVWVGYALAAPGILERRYLSQGWREVQQ